MFFLSRYPDHIFLFGGYFEFVSYILSNRRQNVVLSDLLDLIITFLSTNAKHFLLIRFISRQIITRQ